MIYHFCPRTDWLAARAVGAYTADSLATEGFIHFSTVEQVPLSAGAHAPGRVDLVLLEVDESRLPEPPRWEPADGQVFPHVYGPLPLAAVRAVHAFPSEPDGTYTLPPGVQA